MFWSVHSCVLVDNDFLPDNDLVPRGVLMSFD